MGFLEKLFGKRDQSASPAPTAEGPQSLPPTPTEEPGEKRLSLQVLFGPLQNSALDPMKFVGTLQGLHSSMAAATFKPENATGGARGTLSWGPHRIEVLDRKSTRLNSSHRCISYAVFCL